VTTTPTTRDEFFEALRENRDRPKGRATAALAEELVDAAESFGDPEVTVSALVELMKAYQGSGESVKFPVAFARLLQLWDESPKAFDESEAYALFWCFKWVTTGLLSTPDVPLASIRGWIDEMRRRYQEAGHDLQPVYAQQFHLARELGENEQLAYELWATRGRSRFSDCAACEARQRAAFHFRRGEDERGLAELKPTFDGNSTCDEEPHSSQALALLPLLRLGRYDEARAAHLTGYRKVRGQEAELTSTGRHLQFCALTGNEARGLELLAQSRACFGFMASPSGRLEFLTGVESLLARLVESGRGELPCAGPAGREWTVASLRDEVAAQAEELAGRFDARNGNGVASERRRQALALRPLVAQLNLGVQTTALARPAGASGDLPAPAPAARTASTPDVPGVPDHLPEDFAELLAEARRLDRTGGSPRARALWDAIIERADGADADAADELTRGDIASELAQRAAQRHDWDAAAAHLDESVELYTKAGAPAWSIAAESRVAWCAAVREDRSGTAPAEAAWTALDELLARIDALLAAGFDDDERRREALGRKRVVRQSRVFTARHAMLHAESQEQHARWSAAFITEAQAVIEEGAAAEVFTQPSVAHEVLAEYQATHGAAAEGEAHARSALAIFEEHGWSWRLPRGRMLLALTLGNQGRYEEAMAELERGLAEAPPETAQNELTPLHRMLGTMAVRARQYPTAVRALSETAARLDREGEPQEARETRLHLSRALCAQGAVGDGVAVLESLLDPFATTGPKDADPRHTATDAAPEPSEPGEPSEPSEPSPAEQLTAQIRVDLANALLSLGEHRDAAAQFLHLADAVSRWPEKGPLTSAAAGAAGALAQAGNWDGARAALERALESNREAPVLPDVTDALRTLAVEAADARGADAAQEALGYLDQADKLREEFADAAREQFRSVDVDEAQCLDARGRVHAVTGRFEDALAAFEQAAAVYDRAGWATAPPRFEALRMAALVEGRSLERPDAARARLDKAAAEADAAGLSDAAATLRRLRAGLS
jgi:tetratricopeptide (TPR) repeat protein